MEKNRNASENHVINISTYNSIFCPLLLQLARECFSKLLIAGLAATRPPTFLKIIWFYFPNSYYETMIFRWKPILTLGPLCNAQAP